jgi:peptidyl-prolyl cis-trans isomerase B (cyclophilin B)
METDAGTVELELFDADAPATVANFVKLAEAGFYDGLAFHRVIDGFMGPGRLPQHPCGCRWCGGHWWARLQDPL